MGYHQRIESTKLSSFVTTRSRNSELWFINNQPLENAILGYAARYKERYGAKLYALAIEGNHIQAPILFPKANRADFMRDFNSTVAKAVARYTPEYPGGRFWGRRYSQEFLPGDPDLEEQFFYTVLQPVQDGLVQKISEYPGYNCFHDAIWGVERKYKVVRWTDYNAVKRYRRTVSISDYTDTVVLKYDRLPGYEHLTQREYATLMMEKLEKRRVEIVEKRLAEGLGFAGRENLLKTARGARPRKTKTSTAKDHRPRILSVDDARRAEFKAWYFEIYFWYKEASKKYRAGDLNVKFPPGTYKPYVRFAQDPPY